MSSRPWFPGLLALARDDGEVGDSRHGASRVRTSPCREQEESAVRKFVIGVLVASVVYFGVSVMAAEHAMRHLASVAG